MKLSSWCWLVTLLASLPAGAIELPADAERRQIHPGAWAFTIRRPGTPLAMSGFVWDRAERRLGLQATAGRDQVRGLEPTSRQIARLTTPQSRPVAAVNGDFYQMQGGGQGATIGLFVRDGELLGPGYGRPALAVLSDGSPHIGSFDTKLTATVDETGAVLEITRLNNERGPDHLVLYTPAWSSDTNTNAAGVEVVLRWDGRLTPNCTAAAMVASDPTTRGSSPLAPGTLVLSGHGTRAEPLRRLRAGMSLTLRAVTTPDLPLQTAVGGSAVLVSRGEIAYRPKESEPRHPRTAVGFDDQQVVALAVDGRRPGFSRGMTLPELAATLQALGCREAINLDGGGSTTCWVRGKILNRPSDGGERAVANALALVSHGPLGEPATVVFEPAGPLRLARGARLRPDYQVADALLNPLPASTEVSLAVEGPGRLERGTYTATEPGRATLVARAGEAVGRLEIEVLDRMAALRCEPSSLELLPGEAVDLRISGLDANGLAVTLDPAALTWEAPPEAGAWRDGRFVAGQEGFAGKLTVRGYGERLEVPLRIARPELVEDFEAILGGRLTTTPASATATLERQQGEAASGQWFARLLYHLGEEAVTRAAYLRLDRRLGRALALRARVRGDGQRVWLRAALLDGNGVRTTHNLLQGALPATWTTVQADLPAGLKEPLVWESVYLVTLAEGTTRDGLLDWDRLEVVRVP